MDSFGSDPIPPIHHSARNYVLAALAVVAMLFVAGVFGVMHTQPPTHVENRMQTLDQLPEIPTLNVSAGTPTISNKKRGWISYAELTVPVQMGVFNACGDPHQCGETTVITYDGTTPQGLYRIDLPQDDRTWPDLKMTALVRSSKLVYLNPITDMATLEATPSGYARDKNHVYYLKCATYGCGYNKFNGVDPASFDLDAYAPITPQ